MKTEQIEKIFKEGTHVNIKKGDNLRRVEVNKNYIDCVDGFTVSVIAGTGCYSIPRPEIFSSKRKNPLHGFVDPLYAGPYVMVEVGFPSERPKPWNKWKKYCDAPEVPTKTVYGYVPIEMVRELIKSHGGEK